jgi:uroporphyrinogen-III synthase
MRFLIIRPIDESAALAKKLESAGHQTVINPVLTIQSEAHNTIDFSPYQALIFTSVAAIKVFSQTYVVPNLRTYTVGQKSAQEAKQHGFNDIISADGDVSKLAQLITSNANTTAGPLLYLSAVDVAKDLNKLLEKQNFQIDRVILYRALAVVELKEATLLALKKHKIDYIPFYSSRSALIFKEIIKKSNMLQSLNHVTALCLSAKIENTVVDLPWKNLMTAQKPEEGELFNLIGIDL